MTSLDDFFLRVWSARGPVAWLLLPLSLFFLVLIRLRAALYAFGIFMSSRVGVPVVVVGNVIAGGSGKTPVVIALCKALAAAGWVPGVVSRGYGGRVSGVAQVRADSQPALMGDEPVLIAGRVGCPVFVGRERVAAARALLEAYPEVNVLVADDGLQHLALARDVEIVVMDGRGAGNGWLMPAGPLREPVSRLKAADAVVWNSVTPPPGGGVVPQFEMRLAGGEFYCLADPALRRGAGDFSGTIHAIAGIGRPSRFFASLRALGLVVIEHPFPDHHAYTPADLAFAEGGVVLMTEKDAVKCAAFATAAMWVLRVDAVFEPDLVPRVLACLEKLNGRKIA